ncbi:hypothetical protein [Cognatilysobacter segetis]|uniref:hypothetical protein n=1 Tax=Cognatilysobacter segetis TaxID=2492394 RepID=UPI00138FA4C2|nr:hypothetical protein [Lysobacter segetis]
MDSAAAIIDALNARAAASGRLRAAARESWTHWLDRLSQRPGRVSGAPAEELVAQLAAREPAAPPPRAIELNRWQAFATLWRQHWQPGSRDERVWRITAGSASFAWHLVLAILLLIVTAMHFEHAPPPADEAVQIEYIGEGTPVEEGGGPAPSAAAAPGEESPRRAAAVARAASTPTPPTSAQPAASASAPPVTAPQPLTVSKAVPDASTEFTLPPTTLPSQSLQTLREPAPDVEVAAIPERPQAPTVTSPAPTIDIERPLAQAPAVQVRSVPEAVVAPAPTARIEVPVEAPRAAAQSVDIRAREIPARANATAGAPTTHGPAVSAAPSSASGSNASPTAGPASAAPSTGIGTGPKAAPAPGSWATPKRGDDWGESTRNRPGNGVFDGDGRPRVADGPGSASAAHPPGMITDEIKDIDRAGTWLKRKPFPYEPTRWDRLWRPNQTLLEDWVDKGVKQVGIPIPGTNKRIICIISILQLGGGCGISDPDLNEQPATARPPPDVPFKPALQEGNGATWDKDGKAPPRPKLPGLFAPPKSGVPPGAAPAKDAGANGALPPGALPR